MDSKGFIGSSSGSTSNDSSEDCLCGKGAEDANKRQKVLDSGTSGVMVPRGFLASLRSLCTPSPETMPEKGISSNQMTPVSLPCMQFWKAGDYEWGNGSDTAVTCSVGMDHLRVNPKFLHSNATSHKWVLGAFAELLDNALDEVRNGATYVKIDVLKSKKDGTDMLLVEDNGGGMTPYKMRQCMSLGYSAKSNLANTIGKYGNGFKTSTMRLGASVIVFSRSKGNERGSLIQSIGMLSYKFLTDTGKEDIVVPMIDYEKRGEGWKKIIRSSLDDWDRNLRTILNWSPYENEAELLQEFNFVKEHGTRIVIYNLWKGDKKEHLELLKKEEEEHLELDFDAEHIVMHQFFIFTFQGILESSCEGKIVEHHNIEDDMTLIEKITYRPHQIPEGMPNDSNRTANVTIGFIKDAQYHIDVQGFNVYHKNRLIKPFWKVWHATGSGGRGVIGVLEANFVEPAHDKQGFETTTALARLEARLLAMQKNYWLTNCQEVGYAARRKNTDHNNKASLVSGKEKSSSYTKQNGVGSTSCGSGLKIINNVDRSSTEDAWFLIEASPSIARSQQDPKSDGNIPGCSLSKAAATNGDARAFIARKEEIIMKLKGKNIESQKSLDLSFQESWPNRMDGSQVIDCLLNELLYEKDRCQSLKKELQLARQESVCLQNEIVEQELVEKNLREKLQEASVTIDRLIAKVKRLEGKKAPPCILFKQEIAS
ncbi:Protein MICRORCHIDIA like [Quillaja saponaria]|uniref:Protein MICRORCHIDIA like n=1 Tax=Quillaja saponaria TaxID=32244 RepID=A0AAD7KT92_QUISA|nr:Protein MICRORCHIDIA like [Quillaja saponaria]